jgi:hypothetical protein
VKTSGIFAILMTPPRAFFYRALTTSSNGIVLNLKLRILRNAWSNLRILSGGLTLELSALYGAL